MKKMIADLRQRVLDEGQVVKTTRWQGKSEHPEFLELLHVNVSMQMFNEIENMQKACNPMLPWADEHFQERISGEPLNPPPSHKHWLKGNEKYMSGDKFSHSYPERFWPKTLLDGIRFDTADLDDLILLLKKEPDTRQAYLPIYFPEDLTAARRGERIPCTLGYHFIVRNGRLDLFYPMRSCDIIRHMHNDIYLANRLAKYVRDKSGLSVHLGELHFHVTSLHCFMIDRYAVEKAIKCAE